MSDYTGKQIIRRCQIRQFVCFFLWGFSLIWSRHHYRWRVANIDLCLAFMARGIFSMSRLLWHGASVYNPFIIVISEEPMTHTCCRALSSGAVSTCFYNLGLSRLGFEHPAFCTQGKHPNWLHHRLRFRFYCVHVSINSIIHFRKITCKILNLILLSITLQ